MGSGGEHLQKFFPISCPQKNLGYENENKGSGGGYLILTTWVIGKTIWLARCHRNIQWKHPENSIKKHTRKSENSKI